MSASSSVSKQSLVASFLERLPALDAVIKVIVSGAKMSFLMELRGADSESVLLDFSPRPMRVERSPKAPQADVLAAMDADRWHDLLSDRVKAGELFGRRELLIRGPSTELVPVIRILGFAPLLYREHLADVGYDGHVRRTGWAPMKESLMRPERFTGKPIAVAQVSGFERFVARIVNGVAFAAGYLVGTLRYRVLENLSLFEMLGCLARGYEAAMPASSDRQRGELPAGRRADDQSA